MEEQREAVQRMQDYIASHLSENITLMEQIAGQRGQYKKNEKSKREGGSSR